MSIKAFLRQNAIPVQNKKLVVSPRFLDEDGKPMEWELCPLSEDENAKIKDSCTARTIFKGRQSASFDGNRYTRLLCVKSIVFPELADAELQKSYCVTDSEDLLGAMLLPGEFTALMQFVHEVNGFDAENFEEAKEEAKNS